MSKNDKCYGEKKNRPGGKTGNVRVVAGKGLTILNKIGRALLSR